MNAQYNCEMTDIMLKIRKNVNMKILEKYKIRDYYMILVEVVDNIFYLFEQQCKKQKEAINKAIEYILKETKSMPVNGCTIRLKELLDILKEVDL